MPERWALCSLIAMGARLGRVQESTGRLNLTPPLHTNSQTEGALCLLGRKHFGNFFLNTFWGAAVPVLWQINVELILAARVVFQAEREGMGGHVTGRLLDQVRVSAGGQ